MSEQPQKSQLRSSEIISDSSILRRKSGLQCGRRNGRLNALLGLTILLATPSCVRLDWSRISNYTPIPEKSSMGLEVGESVLDDCLDQFGSPLWVLEHPIANRDGALLAWGWFSATKVGLRLSFAFDRAVNTSLEYQQTNANMEGIVAVFDGDWKLVELKRGLLKNLTTDIPKVRPRAVLSN